MKVNNILETALYAEDLEAAEAFYTRVQGRVFKIGQGRAGRAFAIWRGAE